MIDFTHTKKPDFLHLVLIIAVVCLALGAITPAASAVDYEDISFSSLGTGVEISGTVDFSSGTGTTVLYNALPGGLNIEFNLEHIDPGYPWGGGPVGTYEYSGYYGSLSDIITNSGIFTDLPYESYRTTAFYHHQVLNLASGLTSSEADVYVRQIAEFLEYNTEIPASMFYVRFVNGPDFDYIDFCVPYVSPNTYGSFSYSYEPYSSESLDLSLTAFGSEDPAGMYVLSLDGSLLDTTYTVGINRYTSEFTYLVDSYAYTDGSGSYIFTGSRSLTLPIYYNSYANMPYSYEVSVNINDEDGYLDERYLVYWSDLGGLYDTVPDALVPTPTPTITYVPPGPVDPSNIIPDPDSLSDTINITGWYQDQGFLTNSITSPIYSGLDGFFTDTLVPFYDFFLTPIGSLASMISDSAGTSKDAIYDSVDQLSIYAAPFNTVGGYVVLLVPDVVWVVVFAALTIGYAVLLIRISTGSIKDTIGRFLGGK